MTHGEARQVNDAHDDADPHRIETIDVRRRLALTGSLVAGISWFAGAGCTSTGGETRVSAEAPSPAPATATGPALPESKERTPVTVGATGAAEYRPSRRVALLISNGNYPGGQDLPPARKNLTDMTAALKSLDFEVTAHLDLDAAGMRRAVREFGDHIGSRRFDLSKGDSLVVFYFCGHGLEIDGVNLLVPAGIDPAHQDVLDRSFKLTDVMAALPQGYPGVVLSFVDACRISLGARSGDLNQVRPPEGTIIMFGTRKGRPALAPNVDSRNTFFTGAVVESLREPEAATSVYDFCRIVEDRCLQTVKQEFQKLKLSFAPQHPQTAANIRGTFRLTTGAADAKAAEAEAETRWTEIERTVKPYDLVRLCEAFLQAHPKSAHAAVVKVRLSGAKDMLAAVRAADFSRDGLIEEPGGQADYREDFVRALRGDKDAALRVAERYRSGRSGIARNDRRYEQWLRIATELGNGIASWALYEYYNEVGGQDRAARFRKRATEELGYRPPKEVVFK